jgi:protein-disulfide isomerase
MHDTLFKNPRALMVDNLKHFARTLGLKEDNFNTCLDQGKYAQAVSEHQAAGSAVGVTGTPTFFIGKTSADGTIEATVVRGAQPYAAFKQAIDSLLSAQK